MELTWHGHSTWHVEIGGTTILIDPFFSNPKTDVSPAELNPEYVLLTHGHMDHIADIGEFDEQTIATTPELAEFVTAEYGIDEENTIGYNIGGTIELGDAIVTMVRADHTNGINSSYEYSGGPPAGYVISDTNPTKVADEESETFYHSGDTALMSEMKDVIGPFLEPDVAALPAGDHFTMGPMQAGIAADWLDVEYAIPMHYDTMEVLELDTADFERAIEGNAPTVEPVILDGDETFTYE